MPGAAQSTPRRRGRPPKTSHDDVLDAGLRVIDRDGVSGLTMRAVADELDIGAMTLYNYVATREELIDKVGGRGFVALNLQSDEGAPWTDQLYAALCDVLDALMEHPGLADLMVSPQALGPQLDHTRDRTTGLLRGAGFTQRESVDALSTLVGYVLGAAMLERARSGRADALRSELTRIDPAEFPHLTEEPDTWVRPTSVEVYRRGLAALIDDIARRVPQSKENSHVR